MEHHLLKTNLPASGAGKVRHLSVAGDGIGPFVPCKFRMGGAATAAEDLRNISKRTGLRRFLLTGPGFDEVMYAPFADDLYAKMGAEMAEVKRLLSDTAIELGWWCAPSIRYVSGFASIEDASGNKSKDNKKCPLDPAFQSDWSAKVKSVAAAFRPAMICIEDDYTLAWGRGLNGCACFCPRHLASFASRYGKALTGPEIAAAFANRTKENEPIRRAFAETVRASLAELAGCVRAAVDEVDPSIRIMLCESGACSDYDGDALETLARTFSGPGTRPCVRPSGAIYGAQTTPADIPPAVAHTMFTLERLPRDIETFYEADPYPHNRFFTSAAQMQSLMAGAMFMGSQNILFYCLQYLDDPLEDPGYAEAYRSMRPRLETVRSFVADRHARLAGVRVLWHPEDSYLTHGIGGGHGGQLADGAFLCAKMGLPYTTRADAEGPVMMMGNVAETMSDDEIRRILSGGVLLDAPAAALLQRRGFGAQLGADVELADGRLPVIGERLLPAAGLSCNGRTVNAFYILSAGTEGTVTAFATLRPRAGTEVWSEFTGVGGKLVTPSVTYATNSLGGRVAILATSLLGNRSSGLYNLRKQELLRNLFNRLAPGTIPVAAVGAPGIWTLAQLASDGKEMLVMVNNLSGDERTDVEFDIHQDWVGASVSWMDRNGALKPLGSLTKRWKAPLALGQMSPEFLVVEKKPALVLRFDDNKSPQQWQEIAEIFEAIGGRCSFAVNPAWLNEEQWAKLRELSARGHEIMDHTPQHAIFKLEHDGKVVLYCPEVDLAHAGNVRVQASMTNGVLRSEDSAFIRVQRARLKFFVPSIGKFYGLGTDCGPKLKESAEQKCSDFWGRWTEDSFERCEVVLLDDAAVQPSLELLRAQARESVASFKAHGLPPPKTWIRPGGWEGPVDWRRMKAVYGDEFGYKIVDAASGEGLEPYSPWNYGSDFGFFDFEPDVEKVYSKAAAALAGGHSFAYISHQWTNDRAQYLDRCRQLAEKLKANGIRMTTYSHIAG